MVRLDRRYPAFGFSHNKGYGTREHWRALDTHGPTPVHRLSFSGVGQAVLPGIARTDAPAA
jgi:ribonuclease HII